MTPPNEPREPDELAIALNAIPVPHPTDPTITNYERQGRVIAWHKDTTVTRAALRLPRDVP